MDQSTHLILKKVMSNTLITFKNSSFKLLVFIMAFVFCACGDDTKKDNYEDKTKVKIQNKQQVSSTKSTDTPETNSLGKRVFILCASCHNLKKDEPHKVGPNLYGIAGRKAATKEGFKYSEALVNSGIVWNKETIAKWIENPDLYIPGSNMAFVGVKNKKQQEAVIEYIMEQTKK